MTKKAMAKATAIRGSAARRKYPRDSIEKALKVPKLILEQNAGKSCTYAQAAKYAGLKRHSGPFGVGMASAIKYGLLSRPEKGKIEPTDLAKRILRPGGPDVELDGYREAVQKAPLISEVYTHYRGENLPDDKFFKNTLNEKFGIPEDEFPNFKQIFLESLQQAKMIDANMAKVKWHIALVG